MIAKACKGLTGIFISFSCLWSCTYYTYCEVRRLLLFQEFPELRHRGEIYVTEYFVSHFDFYTRPYFIDKMHY